MTNIKNIELKKYRFIFEDREDFQRLLFFQYCQTWNIPAIVKKDIKREELKENDIPFGTVNWTENLLGINVVPDYFPFFLKNNLTSKKIWSLVSRRVWRSENLDCFSLDAFIKPADRYKRFDGHIYYPSYEKSEFNGPFIWSEIVNFINEWRYYVFGGEIIESGWYKGVHDIPCLAPKIPLLFPKNYCGIVDIGTIIDSSGKEELELVECCHPYSFGWYSSDWGLGLRFIVCGWRYMQKLVNNENI